MKILRQRPDFSNLKRQGYVAVDMHLHSEYSVDCSTKVKDIVRKAKKNGFGIAITDHDEIGGALEASKTDVFLIPGIEVTCEEGVHMLVYFYELKDLKNFYSKHIRPNSLNELRTSIKHRKLLKIASKYKCVVSAPHGFSYGCGLYAMKKHAEVEFVEALNASIRPSLNEKAQALKKKFTAGTDAHFIDYIGRSVVCAKAKNTKEFLDKLRKGDVLLVGKEINIVKWILVNARKEASLWFRMKPKELIRNRMKQTGLK